MRDRFERTAPLGVAAVVLASLLAGCLGEPPDVPAPAVPTPTTSATFASPAVICSPVELGPDRVVLEVAPLALPVMEVIVEAFEAEHPELAGRIVLLPEGCPAALNVSAHLAAGLREGARPLPDALAGGSYPLGLLVGLVELGPLSEAGARFRGFVEGPPAPPSPWEPEGSAPPAPGPPPPSPEPPPPVMAVADTVDATTETLADTTTSVTRTVLDTAETTGEDLGPTTGSLTEAVTGTVEPVTETVTETTTETVSDTTNTLAGTTDSTVQLAEETASTLPVVSLEG